MEGQGEHLGYNLCQVNMQISANSEADYSLWPSWGGNTDSKFKNKCTATSSIWNEILFIYTK